MTAFVVFSYMGFYPITPGKPEYTIGIPIFEKVTTDMENKYSDGKKLFGSQQVHSECKIDGKVLNVPSFTHDQRVAVEHLKWDQNLIKNGDWRITS